MTDTNSNSDGSPRNWYRIDKTSVEFFSLEDPPDDVQYWRTRSMAERFEAIEYMRWMNYGEAATTGRLQRVLEITQRA